jgi:multidrug resistance efflux pump
MKKFTTPVRISFIFLLFSSILLAGCSSLASAAEPTPTTAPVTGEESGIIVEGHVSPRDTAQLFFAVSGSVEEVLVKEGDQVAKGDVLARLSDRETYQAAVTAAELELTTSQQNLDDLNENSGVAYNQALLDLTSAQRTFTEAEQKLADLDTDEYQNDIDDARKTLVDAKEDLDNAQEEFDKYKDLDEDNTTRKNAEDDLMQAQEDYDQALRDLEILLNDLDKAKNDVEFAHARVDQAQLEVDKRKDGPDADALALAQARLNNAQAQLSAAEAALGKLDLVAPFDGIITSLELSTGERAILNQPVMGIADFSEWYVETSDLTEKEVVNIKLGQKVIIVPDALPDEQLTGVVTEISDDYIEKSGDITYKVRILLNDIDPLLRWGMTVEVQFPTQ